MKKSKSVPGVLLTSVAAAIMIVGCGPKEVRRCVDNNGVVLNDNECERTTSPGYIGANHYYPHWVYGGSGGMTPGSRAMGFRATPSEGARIVNSAGHSISRGGFGGSSGGHSFGGFGG